MNPSGTNSTSSTTTDDGSDSGWYGLLALLLLPLCCVPAAWYLWKKRKQPREEELIGTDIRSASQTPLGPSPSPPGSRRSSRSNSLDPDPLDTRSSHGTRPYPPSTASSERRARSDEERYPQDERVYPMPPPSPASLPSPQSASPRAGPFYPATYDDQERYPQDERVYPMPPPSPASLPSPRSASPRAGPFYPATYDDRAAPPGARGGYPLRPDDPRASTVPGARGGYPLREDPRPEPFYAPSPGAGGGARYPLRPDAPNPPYYPRPRDDDRRPYPPSARIYPASGDMPYYLPPLSPSYPGARVYPSTPDDRSPAPPDPPYPAPNIRPMSSGDFTSSRRPTYLSSRIYPANPEDVSPAPPSYALARSFTHRDFPPSGDLPGYAPSRRGVYPPAPSPDTVTFIGRGGSAAQRTGCPGPVIGLGL